MRREYTANPGYAAVKAAFPGVKLDGGDMTPAQGRLCFHQERLLWGHPKAHRDYVERCRRAALPERISEMSYMQCILALGCLEAAARAHPVIGRDPRTGWEQFPSEEVKHG